MLTQHNTTRPESALPDDTEAPSGTTQVGRVSLKAPGTPTGAVDGAWWPQSGDLAAEVADLLPALAGRVSAVSRVIYHLPSWNPAPSRIVVGGRIVRLDGYRYQPINTVYIVGTDRDRIALLVVPPATDPADAHATMAAATAADNVSTRH